MSAALFEYTIRESLRARCIRLRVTPQKGLEVVLPRDCSRSRIPPILERKQCWIRSALERVEAHRLRFPPMSAWQVKLHPEETARVMVRECDEGLLQLRGNVGQQAIACQAIACRAALHRWWLRQGRKHLVPMLHEISRETGWSFERASVRRQRTRWGSCSRRKSVSLNAKLLFLDPALVRYVMVHELCHTREMNHARRWQARAQQLVRVLQHSQNGVACGKAILNLCNVPVGPCRLPLPVYDTAGLARLRPDLDAIGFFNWKDGAESRPS